MIATASTSHVATSNAGGEHASPRAIAPARFELAGPADAPVVVAMGGISATRHVVSTPDDPSPGWWQRLAGPGAALDTTRFRVLGIDYADGGRAPDGRPARPVTTAEQADALAAVLDHLDVRVAHAVIGASYGGMVALAFAERHPARSARLVVVSAAHESHPMSTALRLVQRRIVELGLETGRPHDAMALARGLAMTTYRTAREFAERFRPGALEADGGGVSFDVEGYLVHHGRRFALAMSPERFLALSLSCDLHRVVPAAIRVSTLLVAAEGDTLVPVEQMEALARELGGVRRLLRLRTRHGHDAFLCEPVAMGRIIRTALAGAPVS